MEIRAAQLVHKYPGDDKADMLLSSKHYLCSEKIDGYWSQIVHDADGVHMYSRLKSKKTGFYNDNIDKVPHIKEFFEKSMPVGSCVICEVYVRGGTSKDVTSILGALPQKAIARQEESEPLHVWMHDILSYGDNDFVSQGVDYGHRYGRLKSLFNDSEFVDVAAVHDSMECDIHEFADSVIGAGGEGVVCVDSESQYRPNSRNIEMFKIKRHDTFDCVVMDLIEPTVEYSGKNIDGWPFWKMNDILYDINSCDDSMAARVREFGTPVTSDWFYGRKNAIEIGVYAGDSLIPIGRVSSGLTVEDREDMSRNPVDWIGSVVEIGAMSVDNDAKTIRHPIFVCRRMEKSPKACTVESVFG